MATCRPISTACSASARAIEQLEQLAQALAELQGRFFTELKAIGDRVGITLPEPDDISLLISARFNFRYARTIGRGVGCISDGLRSRDLAATDL